MSILCTEIRITMIWHSIFRSGKSHSGTNQQDAFLLKAILTELQERHEDCVKLKEAVGRLEVGLPFLFLLVVLLFVFLLFSTYILLIYLWFILNSFQLECSKRFPRCFAWARKWALSCWTARGASERLDGIASGEFFVIRTILRIPNLKSVWWEQWM